jgi:Ca2+-binding EF-hand superfamily protein
MPSLPSVEKDRNNDNDYTKEGDAHSKRSVKNFMNSFSMPYEVTVAESSVEPQIHISSAVTCSVHDVQAPPPRSPRALFTKDSAGQEQLTSISGASGNKPPRLTIFDEEDSIEPAELPSSASSGTDALMLQRSSVESDAEWMQIEAEAEEVANSQVLDELPLFSEEEVIRLQNIFDKYDVDGSFSIDTRELGAMLFECFGIAPSMDLVREIFHDLDHDITNGLEFEDFLNLMEHYRREATKEAEARAHFSKEEVLSFKKLFEKYDYDQSGFLSYKELDPILVRLKRAPRNKKEQQTLAKVMQELDKDNSGTFDFAEFLQLAKLAVDNGWAARNPQEKAGHS